MRIRQDAWDPAAAETLHWYGVAVAAMRDCASTDPLGWDYQARMHGADKVPLAMKPFWSKCQHGTSFFLSWHRMYLLQFERIVTKHVVDKGGPATWALPYWNYSPPTGNPALPRPFMDPASPLFTKNRGPGVNSPEWKLDARDIALETTLEAEADHFFGGEQPAHNGNEPGQLESAPHNLVHRAVGGWMGDFNHAALDPVFWIHHCNIDRLWDVWLARSATNKNPTAALWLSGVAFTFHDANGAKVQMKSTDVLEGLDYRYQDTSDPLAAPPKLKPRAPVTRAGRELVGSTNRPTTLGETTQHVEVDTPVTPAAFRQTSSLLPASAFAPDAPVQELVRKVWLRLEHVTSTAVTPAYDVYIAVPDSADPEDHEDHFAGRIAMFGIAEASDPDSEHGGAGQNFSLDITRVYHDLFQQQVIDPAVLKVSFVPVDPAANATVTVGRIALYFA